MTILTMHGPMDVKLSERLHVTANLITVPLNKGT